MKKIALLLSILAVLSLTGIKLVSANGIALYVNLDQAVYGPGDSGRISIVIRNTSVDPIEVENLSIQFVNWMIYTEDGWTGNETIVYDEVITIGSNKTVALDDIRFEVPTDGRAVSTSAHLYVFTNKPAPLHDMLGINVISTYEQSLLRSLDNLVLLLTVVAILAIIGAILIAAAVFLSGRKPTTV